jgi:hypothetical protein
MVFTKSSHHQLSGENIMLIWDNPNVPLKTGLRAFATTQP